MAKQLYGYTFTVTTPFMENETVILRRLLPRGCDMEDEVQSAAEEAAAILMKKSNDKFLYHELFASLSVNVSGRDK